MSESITEDRIVKAYRAALNYGPEPFHHEDRAHYALTSEMMDFLVAMDSSDLFTNAAYHTAGKFGVDTLCVDWMQDVAEESDGVEEFIEILLDGYGEGEPSWYVYRTRRGKEKAGPYPVKEDAVQAAGQLQFETSEQHHVVKKYEEDE